MDFDSLITAFAKEKGGEFLLTDENNHILARTGKFDLNEDKWKQWCERIFDGEMPKQDEVWEITDRKVGKMYRISSEPKEVDGEKCMLHHMYDVSEYAMLIRELSSYTKERQAMASFQAAIIKEISSGYRDCLPVILRFLKLESLVLYVGREKYTESLLLKRSGAGISVSHIEASDCFSCEVRQNKDLEEDGNAEYLCYMNEETIDGVKYALFFRQQEKVDDLTLKMYFNVIRLFIENSLLREKIIYESEHDKLTGIYNKGKYISMMESFFPHCERIAVFNMDVNYLKRLNDSLGHEVGDKLLIKAAKSMMPLESDTVAAFRMGGDEFMMIAWDLEEEDAKLLKSRWQEELKKLNQEDDGIECVVACGMVYGGKDHDLEAMLKEADALMYKDKVAIKTARGDDPNAR